MKNLKISYLSDDKTFGVVSFDIEKVGTFSVTVSYDEDADCWVCREPKNAKGYKIYKLDKDIKKAVLSAFMDINK